MRLSAAILGGVVSLLWAVYLVQPPGPAGTNLDQSWRLGITLAARDHLQFGRDIVFTFGPLGYVLSGVPEPALAMTSLLVSLVVAIIVAGSLVFSVSGRAGLLQRAIYVVALLALSTLLSFDYIAVAGAVALLTRAARFPRLAVLTGTTIGILALFGLLSKYTLGVDVLAAAVAAWAVDAVRGPSRRRRSAIVAAACAAAIVAVGLGATLGFSPSAMAQYVRGAAEISSGYSAAMAVSGPVWQVVLAIAVALAIVVVGFIAWRQGKPTLLAIAAVTLFLAWKHGFVRQDGHIAAYFGTAAAIAAIIAPAVRGAKASIAAVATAVFAFGVYLTIFVQVNGDLPPVFSLERLQRDIAYASAPVEVQAELKALEPTTLAADRLPDPLLAQVRDSSVDVLPTEVALIEANGLRWNPLPVFQAYSAYTPALDDLNRKALIAHGAASIFLEYAAIDERLPFGEMPATTDELVCRYRAASTTWNQVGPRAYLLLRRLPGAFCDASPAGVATDVAIGTPIVVPPPKTAREFVVASFALKPTFFTKFRTAVWRAPKVSLEVTYADATVRRFRLVAETLADGVIVSPSPNSYPDAAAFLAGLPHSQVRTIAVIARPGAYVLDHVTFTRMDRKVRAAGK